MRRATLCTLALTALTFGCGGNKQEASEDAASQEAAASPAAATAGPKGDAAVTGMIHFAGTPPANPTIDMSEEAECQAKYGGSAPTDSQYVVSNGGLGNVFVYVKSGLPEGASYSAPAAPVVLDQRGCLYHPRAFGVQAGQKIEIKNSDPVLHNIKAVPKANRGFNISQPSAGMTSTRTFNKPEVMVPIECNVHGWMHANLGVLPHPFFTTSSPDGRFTIEGLPPGTYTIEAWHEKLGTQTSTVTVGAGEKKTVDFNFGSKA